MYVLGGSGGNVQPVVETSVVEPIVAEPSVAEPTVVAYRVSVRLQIMWV